jgi:hypothetical protein
MFLASEVYMLHSDGIGRGTRALRLAAIAYVVLSLGYALAQAVSLAGSVKTRAGVGMAGVQVRARKAGSTTTRTTVTDANGAYRFDELPAGDYVVSVVPRRGEMLDRTCAAKPAPTSPCDFVAPATAMLAEGPIGSTSVRDLPINGRDVAQATTLQAGVAAVTTQQSAADVNSGRGQRGFGQQISLAGARPQQNNYMLDGITTNDYANSAPGSVLGYDLGAEAVERVAVNTSSYPAENGRSSGGVVRAITRSGSDTFHGSVYEFLRNDALDASNYFDRPKPSFRRNQFGAAAGMALRPHHSFLFANYEGLRQSLGMTQVDTVLSQAARQGQLANGPVVVNALTAPYLRLFPLPNGGLLAGGDTGIFRFSGQQVTGEDYVTTRVDHTLGAKDRVAGTYSFDRARTAQPDQLDFKLTGLRTRRQVLSVAETHQFAPELMLSSRVGVNRDTASIGDNPGAISPLASDTSLGFLPGATPGRFDIVGITSFPGGLNSSSKFDFHWTSMQAYQDLAVTKGRHNVTAGFAVERTRDNMAASSNQNGTYTFQSIADFLTNRPFALSLEIPGSKANRGLRQTILGLYAQDQMRVRPSVTLTLGLRYETASVPTDVQGHLSALRHVQDGLPHLGDPYFANPTRRNFEPRFGFGWSPGHGRTVVRGGFGIFDVLPLSYEFEVLSLFAAPFVQIGTPTNLPPGSFPYGAVAIAESAGGPRRNVYIQPEPRRNYVMQWNTGIEESITKSTALRVAYVGSRGVHQPFRADDINIVMPSALTSAGYIWPVAPSATPKLNPAVGRLDGLIWVGDSYYDGLQLQLQTTLPANLQVQGSYTWGKSIDTGSATIVGDQFSNSVNSLPWFDTRLNRGVSDFNVAQNVSLHFNWPLPTPALNSFKGLMSGWQVGGTFRATSGAPFTVLLGGDPLGLRSTDSTDVPDRVLSPGCANPFNNPRSSSYLNLDCFRFPVLSNRRGNLARNSLTGPGLQTLDLSLRKDNFVKRVADRFNVQFQIEAFNVLNRANFAPPLDHKTLFNQDGTRVPGAGLIDSTQTPPRQIQLGLKLIW